MALGARRGAGPAWWSGVLPGDYVLLKFGGDPVWHEMLVCGLGQGGLLSVHTPDGDSYVMPTFGERSWGPERVEKVRRDGQLPGGSRREVYRFPGYPSSTELRKLIQTGEADIEKEGDLISTTQVTNAFGQLVSRVAFMKAVDVGRSAQALRSRLRSKSADHKSKDDKKDASLDGAPIDEGEETEPVPVETGSTDKGEEASEVWVASEPLANFKIGDALTRGDGDKIVGRTTGLFLRSGFWVKGELVEGTLVKEYAKLRREVLMKALVGKASAVGAGEAEAVTSESGGLSGLRARLGRAVVDETEAPAAKEVESEELRTLTVDYDGQGERWKDWRSLCREISVAEFHDWPIEGPRTAVHLLKHCERHGKLPTGYLERWAKNKKVDESDRIYHEMKVLMESLELLGSYDQLNLGSLAGVERMCRRLQTIFDAYDVNPAKPNFESAKLFSGMGAEMDPVAPELRSHVAKKARDEAEIEKQRQKARELRKAPPPNRGSGGKGGGE